MGGVGVKNDSNNNNDDNRVLGTARGDNQKNNPSNHARPSQGLGGNETFNANVVRKHVKVCSTFKGYEQRENEKC